jgi:hypothetical protein
VRRCAAEHADGDCRGVPAQVLDGQQRPAHDAAAQLRAVQTEDGRVGGGVKRAQRSSSA